MLVADCHALLRMLQSVFETTLHTVLVKSKALERHSRCFHNSHSFLQVGLPWHHVCNDVQVICAEGVSDYRATIAHVLQAEDAVLEIGCGECPLPRLRRLGFRKRLRALPRNTASPSHPYPNT